MFTAIMFKFTETAMFRIARGLSRRSFQQLFPAGAVFRDLLQDHGYIRMKAAFGNIAAVNIVIETPDQMRFTPEFVHRIKFVKYGIAIIHAATDDPIFAVAFHGEQHRRVTAQFIELDTQGGINIPPGDDRDIGDQRP